jgi:phage terminase small subunit
MSFEDAARLRDFARLIALGYPPTPAAMHAGYSNLRASRAATRLAPRPAARPRVGLTP